MKEHPVLYKDATDLGYCRHFEGTGSNRKRPVDTGSPQTPSKRARVNLTSDDFLRSMEEEVKSTSTLKSLLMKKPEYASLLENHQVNAHPNINQNNQPPQVKIEKVDGFMTDDTSQFSLPVISNVMSGYQEEADTGPEQEGSAPRATPTSLEKSPAVKSNTCTSVTPAASSKVSATSGQASTLCWNCGYCDFVTLSQALLKQHLKQEHACNPHKYVAMLVSSEETNRIRKEDAKLMSTPVVVASESNSNGSLLKDNDAGKTGAGRPLRSDSVVVQDGKESGEEKPIPISFKCAHCHFSSSDELRVKEHMLTKHVGSVLYGIDLRAVKLGRKRYVFYCLKKTCKFFTKTISDYIKHVDTCKPWTETSKNSAEVKKLKQSFEMTLNFIEKNSLNGEMTQSDQTSSSYIFQCQYCSYSSDNHTRIKKHVIMNHVDSKCVFQGMLDAKRGIKGSIYFCKLCLWETSRESDLGKHDVQKHANKSADTISVSSREGSIENSPINKIENEFDDDNGVEKEVLEEIGTDTYDGMVSKSLYESALEQYLESTGNKMAPAKGKPGRPPRNAAAKCKMGLERVSAPKLYRCLYCTSYIFGIKLVYNHMKSEHKLKGIQAIDVQRQSEEDLSHIVNICPAENCFRFSFNYQDLCDHAMKVHERSSADADMRRLAKAQPDYVHPAVVGSSSHSSDADNSSSPKPTSAKMFQCLYCDGTRSFLKRVIFKDVTDLKKHMMQNHKDDEFVYRDVEAWKAKQPCRFYMCRSLTCDFSSLEREDHRLHSLAHQEALIFQCGQCSMNSTVMKEVDNHVRETHESSEVIPMTLKLDSAGDLVRVVQFNK